MQEYYAARASEYDSVYIRPERQADLRQIEQWLPTLFAGKSVLEVACGTGYWTQFIAPLAAAVVAVDAAPETLRIAASRVPSRKVRLLVGDAYALPLLSERPNAGFAGFWWSHVQRSQATAFLRGFHAALTPGATVVLLDNRYVEGSSTPICESDAEGNSYQLRRLRDGSIHRVLKNFPTRAELLAAIEGVALEATYHEWQHYWALRYTTSAP
jgi:demethylmenaquinone methyltransferase/2-methoxy-6-polyprenyl-1,4-benzoquinol methylase